MKKTKRIISILLTAVMLLGLLPAGIISVGADGEALTPDISWYKEDQKTLYIGTAAELLALSQLMNPGFGNISSPNYKKEDETNPLCGKTIELTADIDLNPGWDAATKQKPANTWMGIRLAYNVVIDGKGHSISGLYGVKTDNNRVGFVGGGEGVTVKNLAILNSYFFNDKDGGTGSVIANATYSTETDDLGNYNTIENVYSNAIIECTVSGTNSEGQLNGGNAGGLIGGSGTKVKNGNTLRNCVFAGSVTAATSRFNGGLVGNGNNQLYTIENCVNLGTIYSGDEVGGIIGRNGTKTTTITNCVNLGVIDCVNSKALDADIIGKQSGGTLTMKNCYHINGAGKDTPRAAGTGSGANQGTQTNVNYLSGGIAAIATALAADDSFATWTKLAGTTVSLPKNFVETFKEKTQKALTEDVLALYVTIGYQEPTTGTDKIRFVGIVKMDEAMLADFNSLGFEIKTTYNGQQYTKTVSVDTVYTSVMADGAKVEASTFGGNYFYVVEIDGLDAALADTNEDIVMAVSVVTVRGGVKTVRDLGFTYTVEKAAA